VATHDVIVIGASSGGIDALRTVAHGLPPVLPAAVFVVLHVPPHRSSALPRILTRAGPLPAHEAVDGESIASSRIYVARPDHHLLLGSGHVRVVKGPMENRYSPSIDALFRSAAHAYGPRTIAVVLTGLLDDGAGGVIAVKRRGGLVVVQDPRDADYPDMPHAALDAVSPDHLVPAIEIPGLLARLAETVAPPESDFPVPIDLEVEDSIAQGAESNPDVLDDLGLRSPFSCPDCGGVLWELAENGRVRYRCHVGHAFSELRLFHLQEDTLQESLWAAVKTLRENARLARQIVASARHRGQSRTVAHFEKRAREDEEHASRLQRLVEAAGVDAGTNVRPPAATPANDEPR